MVVLRPPIGTRCLESFPVLNERAAAGSSETGLKHNPCEQLNPIKVRPLKYLFLPLMTSDCYYRGLTILWKGSLQRQTIIKSRIIFISPETVTISLSSKLPKILIYLCGLPLVSFIVGLWCIKPLKTPKAQNN